MAPMQKLTSWALSTARQGAWAPVLVFLVHVVISFGFNAYDRVPRIDILMHYLGGVAIASFLYCAAAEATRLQLLDARDEPTRLVLVLGYVFAATVLWEFAEYLADTFFQAGAQRNLDDTMGDMLNGLLGGCTFLAVRVVVRGRYGRV